MSTPTIDRPGANKRGTKRPGTTTALGRLSSLARAELTLLLRSKAVMFTALFVPLVLPFSVSSAVDDDMLKDTGLTLGLVLMPAAIGFSLLFAVYNSALSTYVVRREELVLKRLRTGELSDREILVGAAVPALLIGLAQCLVLAVGSTLVLDLGAPPAVHLSVLGVLLGVVLMAVLAAVTATFSRTAESAQVTGMPLLLISMLGSGVVLPLETFPDTLASVCEILPLSPVIELVRGGWSGQLAASDALGAVVTAVAWIVIGLYIVQRRFRWEPRR